MHDWTDGYVTDIDYKYGYFDEMNPLRARLAFLNKGLVFPKIETACELGFGQGMSINIHAAASAVDWYGTDFNPSQAGFAQDLAKLSASEAKLYDEAFADFAVRPDLPDFDFIALHGIWSWISDENRVVIGDFIKKKLKVGGVLYVSYNTTPGWAHYGPVRSVLARHAQIFGSQGDGPSKRIDRALDFVSDLLVTDPAFTLDNPKAVDFFEESKKGDRKYLAHEYFNRDWQPMDFLSMADWMTNSKLQFACSALLRDHYDVLNLTKNQQEFLRDIPDANFKEYIKDFMVNRGFRRDYWVKGFRALDSHQRMDALNAEKLMLVPEKSSISLKLKSRFGEMQMDESVYNPILDLLDDIKPHAIEELTSELEVRGLKFGKVIQALMLLVSKGDLCIVQDEPLISTTRDKATKLNYQIMQQAKGSDHLQHLASPVTGGGIAVDRFHQLFLLQKAHKVERVDQMALETWKILEKLGQKVVTKEGVVLQSSEESIAELEREALKFEQKFFPIFCSLQIA